VPSSPTTGHILGMSRPLLSEVFASVPDPRDPRGVRHPLSSVLVIAQAAVAAGARTLLGISEWAGDVDREVLSRLGIDAQVRLPSESTIRRTLAAVDGDDLDRRVAVWMATRVGQRAGRTVIAVDGKSLRGGTPAGGVMPHLLAALHHDSGVVAGQRAVATKSNEIPAPPLLLAGFDLQDVVVTADALHCQRGTAAYVTGRGGHYVLTVKGNQPRLPAQLKALPWTQVPAATTVTTSHARRVRRTVKAVTAPTWLNFPGAAQVAQVRRTRTLNGRRTTEVVYAICSLDMIAAPPGNRRDLAARPLVHLGAPPARGGERPALGPRRRLRRRPPPATHRLRTPSDSHPAQHRHQPPTTGRTHHNRRRPTTSQPQPPPAHRPHHHGVNRLCRVPGPRGQGESNGVPHWSCAG